MKVAKYANRSNKNLLITQNNNTVYVGQGLLVPKTFFFWVKEQELELKLQTYISALSLLNVLPIITQYN